MSFPRIGTFTLPTMTYLSASLSIHMRGEGYYGYVPQKIQIDFECAESEDNVRFIHSERTGPR
jgi:hypothetical protein